MAPEGDQKWWERILALAVQNAGFFMLVLGVAMIVLAAIAKYPKLGLEISGEYAGLWRVLLATVGLLLAVFGAILHTRRQNTGASAANPEVFGLKIQSPAHNESVREKIRMTGTYQKRPTEPVAIIQYIPESEDYWFEDLVTFDSHGTWTANIEIYGEFDEDRILQVVILGKEGRVLRDYYFHVAENADDWYGMKNLTSDILKCDEVRVAFKKTSHSGPKSK